MIRLSHIITDLETGGAEIMLYRLLSCLDRADFRMEVISLSSDGPVGDRIRELDIPVRALRLNRLAPNPLAIWRLTRWLAQSRPHVVQTWMYHANLLGAVAASQHPALIWSLHNAGLSPAGDRARTRLIARACAALSHRIPRHIVCCSQLTLQEHSRLGYAADKMIVIPNGFDLNRFRPDPEARLSLRAELKLPPEALLVGVIARFHPLKGHRHFIRAAAMLVPKFPNLHFVFCGAGVTRDNAQIAAWISQAGIAGRCHLLGLRNDVSRIAAALDVACSPSLSEAFPLAVGEAMACGVPCVATGVGDSAILVGDTGQVVAPGDPEALAAGLAALLSLPSALRDGLGRSARCRIEQHFSLPRIARRYAAVYEDAARHSARNAPSSIAQTAQTPDSVSAPALMSCQIRSPHATRNR